MNEDPKIRYKYVLARLREVEKLLESERPMSELKALGDEWQSLQQEQINTQLAHPHVQLADVHRPIYARELES